MLRLAKLAIAASLAAMAAAPTAMAAEPPYFPPQPLPEPIPELPPPAVSGWYLRGDISYDIFTDPDVIFNEDTGTAKKFTRAEIDDTWNIGFGFGYQFNDWFRADGTFAYHHTTDFNGNTGSAGCCFSEEHAEVTKLTAMANAYLDLGHWLGVTPYVGAGVGAAFVDWSNYFFEDICETCGVRITNRGQWASNADWHFAWALMAGVAVDLTPNLAVDVGYRFVNIDDGIIIHDKKGPLNGDVRFENLMEHEARVGLRYTFGAPPPFIPDTLPPVIASY